MQKIILALMLPTVLLAQQYETNDASSQLDLASNARHKYLKSDEQKVYDVELILFAYNTALPNIDTYTNAPIYDDANAWALTPKPDEINFIRLPQELEDIDPSDSPESAINNNQNSHQNNDITLALEDIEEKVEILAWFEHNADHYSLINIYDKLIRHQNTTPLLHKAWRIGESSFEDPIFIKVSSLNPMSRMQIDDTTQTTQTIQYGENNTSANQSLDNQNEQASTNNQTTANTLHDDLSINGSIALSKGRYLNFEHQLNLFRKVIHQETFVPQNMIFDLTERRIIKTGELNYFDSPWFGSLIKVTEFKAPKGDKDDDTN